MDWLNLSNLSPKQEEAIYESRGRINFFHGPVRSGKTTSQRFAWIRHLAESPHKNLLVSGKTKDTIKRNVLDDMFALFDVTHVPYVYNSSSGTVHVYGKVMHIVGANDESSTDRIHGMTIGGWLGDELTLHPESFVKMALSRMSMKGARAFWTTNPDSPFHYLKKEYLDSELPGHVLRDIPFRLDDNHSLDSEYLESLKLLYHGLWRKRYIDGLWVQAAGAIYDVFDHDRHVVEFLPLTFDKMVVGIDYGTSSVTTFKAWGRNNGHWYSFREYYYDARDEYRQKSNSEFADDFVRFIEGDGYADRKGELYPDSIEIDPSAAGFKVDLRQRGFTQLRNADNDVIEGIRNFYNALANGDCYIHGSCPHTIEEISGYVWDEEKQLLGIDEPMKENDHTCDADRYALKRYYGRPALYAVEKPAGA